MGSELRILSGSGTSQTEDNIKITTYQFHNLNGSTKHYFAKSSLGVVMNKKTKKKPLQHPDSLRQ